MLGHLMGHRAGTLGIAVHGELRVVPVMDTAVDVVLGQFAQQGFPVGNYDLIQMVGTFLRVGSTDDTDVGIIFKALSYIAQISLRRAFSSSR